MGRLDEPLVRGLLHGFLARGGSELAVDGSGLKSDFAALLHHRIDELLVRSGRVAKKRTSMRRHCLSSQPTWRPLCGERDCSALRAMLLSALSVSSLFGDSVHYGIRLFELKALQSSDRSSLKGGPSSLAQSPYARSEARSGEISRGHPPL